MTIRTLVPLPGMVVAVALITGTGFTSSHPEDGSRVCAGAMQTVACVPPEEIPPRPPAIPNV